MKIYHVITVSTLSDETIDPGYRTIVYIGTLSEIFGTQIRLRDKGIYS